MDRAEEELLLLGVVTGLHGLRGDLKVRLFSGDPAALLEARRVFLRRSGESARSYPVERAAVHKAQLLLRLAGCDSVEQAQPLVGPEVLMPAGELPELEEDEFYWYELQGMKVVDVERGEIGVLEDLLSTAAHDIYVVQGPFGEVMIPAVEGFVREVDLANRRMMVDLPAALIGPRNDL